MMKMKRIMKKARDTNLVRPRDSVEALVQELLKGASSDIEKLRAIWMWVTHHIAAVKRTLDQLSVAGIECKEVSGYCKNGSGQPDERFTGDPSHAWNAVRMSGRWHLLDSTWGAGNTGENSSKFKFE
ncbi:hypothetical protein AAFF_G00117870 [Aldrovandia affinis]|uniref:Uncharacterized protein n=1 Tax=Aldrovandia affinis TaxID=143900 RepID=A0AAD7WAL3_9TELE|nr:hypothetical protein AAFF_G00117870 [Aldrovandia affinis]